MRGSGGGVDALGGEVLDQGDQGQVVLVTLATGLQGGEQLVDQGGGRQGNWSTKSRRYSTTFTMLRRARVAFAKRRRARDGIPLDAWNRPEDDDQVVILASWVFVAAGYETEGSGGWRCRPPPVPASSCGWPGRNRPPRPDPPLHDSPQARGGHRSLTRC